MIFGAGVLVADGAEWEVYPGEGMPIQDATCGAGAGDVIYVHEGANTYECGYSNGAGVRTADTKMFIYCRLYG